MMKWRRKSMSSPHKDCVDGGRKDFNRSYSESEILASLSSDSPYEDLMLEDIYNRFTVQNKKDDDTSHDAFVVQTAKNRYHIRHKSDRRLSPASLPSIEEGVESDELASIADSGICDDDFDFDLDNNNKYMKSKSYFEPLKNENDEEFLKYSESQDDLLSCITEELHKRNEHDGNGEPMKDTPGLSDVFISGLNKIEDENDKYITHKLRNVSKANNKLDRRRRAFSSDMTLNLKNESNFMTSLPKHGSRSLQDLVSLDTDDDNNKKEIDSLILPLLTSTPNNDHITGNNIDSRNKQIFSRLKLKADLNKSTIQGINNMKDINETINEDIDLPSSLMSSMLWNGQTSNRPPSTYDVYQTMPPNRYPKRNKDFMTQLKSCPEEESKVTVQTTREFKVNLDVNHYAPEEILVTLEDGKLVVNGKHFSESEYGFESCQFHRRYPIPDGIKTTDIKSSISEEGILSITGRLGRPEVKPRPPKIKEERFSNYDNVEENFKSLFNKVPPQNPPQHSPENRPKTPQIPVPRRSIPQGPGATQENQQTQNTSPESPDARRASPDGSPSSQSKLDFNENHSKYPKHVNENEFNEIGDDMYFLKVDCASYTPDDMEVRVSGRELIVRGRQKSNQLADGQEHIRHKEFTKRFSIPKLADCNTITSKFTDNDILYVEVKKLKKQ